MAISGKVMQPILSTDDTEPITQPNGHVQSIGGMNGTEKVSLMKTDDNNENGQDEKIVLPVEMACMVPLRTLIGKLIHKSHADLMTLTDT